MSTTAASSQPTRRSGAVRYPGPGQFLRLKARIVRNGMRGSTTRVLGFIASAVAGLVAALAGFFNFFVGALLGAGEGGEAAALGLLLVSLFGGFVVLGWLVLPTLFFGIDETLDPARFALLPIPRTRLMTGLLAAAALGIPSLATLLATSGMIVGALVHGVLPSLVAAVGVALGFLTCLIGSRAVTSAFASLLRSRRGRDTAMMLMMLMLVVFGPLQAIGVQAVGPDEAAGPLLNTAGVLAWTPFAAPYAAVFDVLRGAPLVAAVRLGVGAVTILLLWFWWSRTLEPAMVGSSTAGRKQVTGRAGGLAPALLRRALPANPYGAIVARELRYWWRDPRRRAVLLSLGVMFLVLPASLVLVVRAILPSTAVLTGDAVAEARFGATPLAAVFASSLLANQFGYDGAAYAAHLLAAVPAHTEIRGRMTALAVLAVPGVAAAVIAVSLWAGGGTAALLGLTLAALGCGFGVMSIISVYGAYAFPDTTNPFAANAGVGCSRFLVQISALLAVAFAMAPMAAVAIPLWWFAPGYAWLLLPLGIGYGALTAELGARVAAAALAARGPELLAAITPRR